MQSTRSASLWPLLATFSWQELRQQPWRNLAAVVSVMLGVALAFAVHLINASALDEFSRAVRSVAGQPDLQLRSSAASGLLSQTAYAQMLHHPDVAVASPVLELSTYVQATAGATGEATRNPAGSMAGNATGTATQAAASKRLLVRVLGVDALTIASMAPDLVPLPDSAHDRMSIFAQATVFLNASARTALGNAPLQIQQGLQLRPVSVAGDVRAGGAPLAVMDIGAMQDFFGKDGQLSRVDLLLRPGVPKDSFISTLQSSADWSPGLRLEEPGDALQRVDDLSRAYRVNLTVLALVALFTGGFLVFSVLALSVARRAQQFALLAVLGLTGPQRLRLVLLEAAALGVAGSTLGLTLGTALAIGALHFLGGDLGGGYFGQTAPALQWSLPAACGFAVLGVAAALAGAWWPARTAAYLPPAATLKGLGHIAPQGRSARWGVLMLLAGLLLALLPPVGGVPLAAYVSVALLLLGGICTLPWLVGVVLDRLAPMVSHNVLALLAVERSRRVRDSAAIAVSGVVASLSLAVALTVMVGSFRGSVTHWLDSMLPASLYVRTATSGSAMESAYLDPAFVDAAQRLAGVERISRTRSLQLPLDANKPALTLLVRPLRAAATESADNTVSLPLVDAALPVPAGRVGIYISEAVVDLYGVRAGSDFRALDRALGATSGTANRSTGETRPQVWVAGVWRDYARQFGSVAMDAADYARLSTDTRVNELALWLAPDTSATAVEQALRDAANRLAATPDGAAAGLLEFGSSQEIRAVSLKIFDRSFAVTYWLQAVAIGIGLFGVAASFSAQVLARRKEFGLLAHLGLTRRQILGVVASEGAAWTLLGALAGIALGLAVSVVLIKVVNPQSFHWTMDMAVPVLRLLALALGVVVAGTLTAWLSGRAAAGRDAVLAVKEDW
jgi:putative ABC transport system permease protein